MPAYNYLCSKCNKVFEHSCRMSEKPDNIKCKCGGNAKSTFLGMNMTTYVRGYGYCDKSGCRRDMNLYALQNNDPYAQHRASGEKDYIADTLRKSGKHQKNTKFFGPTKS